MRMKTTMIYVTDNEDVIDPDNFAYNIWLGDLSEDYEVDLERPSRSSRKRPTTGIWPLTGTMRRSRTRL